MKTSDIRQIIADISRNKWEIENQLEENGGELTPELLAQSAELDSLCFILETDGIDELGRLLKSVQDDVEARKAEADAAARRLKNLKSYEDYLKSLIGMALDSIGRDKCKGRFYGFTRTESHKTEVLTEELDNAFLEAATEAARDAGLPPYVDVVLKTNTTRIKEYAAANDGEGEKYLMETSAPALRFTKPRANTKKEEE